jgi:hypothetical protein
VFDCCGGVLGLRGMCRDGAAKVRDGWEGEGVGVRQSVCGTPGMERWVMDWDIRWRERESILAITQWMYVGCTMINGGERSLSLGAALRNLEGRPYRHTIQPDGQRPDKQ